MKKYTTYEQTEDRETAGKDTRSEQRNEKGGYNNENI